MFSKDQHGFREKDINYKDRKNYEAVLRMTSDSTLNQLKKIPDPKHTITYLEMMRLVNDSYIDVSISYLERIKKAWYTVFDLRYWRQWIVLHEKFTVADNFISNICAELNAHSLIVHILSLQILDESESTNFLHWLLGSECCEKNVSSSKKYE